MSTYTVLCKRLFLAVCITYFSIPLTRMFLPFDFPIFGVILLSVAVSFQIKFDGASPSPCNHLLQQQLQRLEQQQLLHREQQEIQQKYLQDSIDDVARVNEFLAHCGMMIEENGKIARNTFKNLYQSQKDHEKLFADYRQQADDQMSSVFDTLDGHETAMAASEKLIDDKFTALEDRFESQGKLISENHKLAQEQNASTKATLDSHEELIKSNQKVAAETQKVAKDTQKVCQEHDKLIKELDLGIASRRMVDNVQKFARTFRDRHDEKINAINGKIKGINQKASLLRGEHNSLKAEWPGKDRVDELAVRCDTEFGELKKMRDEFAQTKELRDELAGMKKLLEEVGDMNDLRQRLQKMQSLSEDAGDMNDLRQQVEKMQSLREEFGDMNNQRVQEMQRLSEEVGDMKNQQVQEMQRLREKVGGINNLRQQVQDMQSLREDVYKWQEQVRRAEADTITTPTNEITGADVNATDTDAIDTYKTNPTELTDAAGLIPDPKPTETGDANDQGISSLAESSATTSDKAPGGASLERVASQSGKDISAGGIDDAAPAQSSDNSPDVSGRTQDSPCGSSPSTDNNNGDASSSPHKDSPCGSSLPTGNNNGEVSGSTQKDSPGGLSPAPHCGSSDGVAGGDGAGVSVGGGGGAGDKVEDEGNGRIMGDFMCHTLARGGQAKKKNRRKTRKMYAAQAAKRAEQEGRKGEEN